MLLRIALAVPLSRRVTVNPSRPNEAPMAAESRVGLGRSGTFSYAPFPITSATRFAALVGEFANKMPVAAKRMGARMFVFISRRLVKYSFKKCEGRTTQP